MPDNLPVVLLVHGVNSTGEWHDITINECRGTFECQPVKYRFYHGLWGPLKVYVWPTAAISLAAILLVAGTVHWRLAHVQACSIGLLGLLLLDAIVVVLAEWVWSRDARFVFLPIAYFVLGCAVVVALEDSARIAPLLGAIAATSLYLDLREYGRSARFSSAGSVLCFGAVTLVGQWLVGQTTLAPFAYTMAGLIALMILEPWVRRSIAFRHVNEQIHQAWAENGLPPHVVAHSLGTYLTGHLVNESLDLRLGRVVFTGCVLDSAFPWRSTLGPGARGACWSVKNYVGHNDVVPIVTGWLREIWIFVTGFARGSRLANLTDSLGRRLRWRPLGCAGQRGFDIDNTVVHELVIDRLCEECLRAGAHAPVHNVAERFAGHSTLNQDPDYQCFHWLPYLWGSSPENFDLWKEICREGARAYARLATIDHAVVTPERLQLQNDLAAAERYLLHGPWYWPNHVFEGKSLVPGRPLRAYVEETLASFASGTTLPTTETVLKRLPVLIFAKVALALAERRQTHARPEVIALLEPRRAFLAALCDAIQADRAGTTPWPEPTT